MRDNLSTTQSDEFRALCAAIGFVVINWAVIEQQIDNVVNITFTHCGGRTLRKKGDIPRSLSLKTQFLKDCFNKLVVLKPFAGQGLALIGRVENLSNERHNLVHGAVESIVTVNGAFNFRKIGYEQQAHTLTPFTFHPDDFSKLGKSLGDLLTEQIAFSERLAAKFLT